MKDLLSISHAVLNIMAHILESSKQEGDGTYPHRKEERGIIGDSRLSEGGEGAANEAPLSKELRSL